MTQIVRPVALLLLTLQLQPLAAAAICFQRAGSTSPGCEMTEQAMTTAGTAMDEPGVGAPAHHSDQCAFAAICAPPTVTVLAPTMTVAWILDTASSAVLN